MLTRTLTRIRPFARPLSGPFALPLAGLFAIAVLGLFAVAPGCTRSSVRPNAASPAFVAADAEVSWADWEPATFAQAEQENRIILINVVATWCHWCHVMEDETYADPEVAALLAEHFVTIRVDSDARPDVGERYRAWGWPATAILSPTAEPVTELRGYRNARVFAALLRELIAERDAGPMARRSPAQPVAKPTDAGLEELRTLVTAQLDEFYDTKRGGWGEQQKYPFAAPLEHALTRATLRADNTWAGRAVQTLEGTRKLIDPVWGGVYQYSLRGDWEHPHYEKITAVQAGTIESFSLAARATGDASWLGSADAVRGYMNTFMRADSGVYWTSQDADLRIEGRVPVDGHDYYAQGEAERRALGTPRRDTNVYADLNGMMVAALAEQYAASGDPAVLEDADAAAHGILASHLTKSGGFVHGTSDDEEGVLYLRDQVTMGLALMALHRVSGNQAWLALAESTARFMLHELHDKASGGFWAHTVDAAAVGVFAERRKPLEENGAAARFLIRLHRSTDSPGDAITNYLRLAESALKSVGDAKGIQREGRIVGTYLMAIEEALMTTIEVTVVGPQGDPPTQALAAAALRFGDPRVIVERSLPGERYPDIGKPAVYLCTDSACSSPVTKADAFDAAATAFIASTLGRPSSGPTR